jgi:hypothetical protein
MNTTTIDAPTSPDDILENTAYVDEDEEVNRKSKRYQVATHFFGKGFDTLEEARNHVLRQHKLSPYSMTTQMIAEVIEASRSVPTAEVKIESVDLKSYYNNKQIEKQEVETNVI